MKIWVNGKIKTATASQKKQIESFNPYEGFSYNDLVGLFVRERYSENDEFAILRQRDTKPEEYAEYNTYCEDCKKRAKEITGA